MNFKKCSRCGSFYLADGDVCPKCSNKEVFERSTFKTYLQENGFDGSVSNVSAQTGIAEKHLNRFLTYNEFSDYLGLSETKSKKSKNTNLK